MKTAKQAGVDSASGAMVEALEQIQDVCYYMSEVFDEALDKYKEDNNLRDDQVDEAAKNYEKKSLKAIYDDIDFGEDDD